jgi:ribosomal protein L7Ae-like RNA K-turn-binding protein
VRDLSLLGIAQAAGYLVSGHTACDEAMKLNRVCLLILACDASEKVKRKFTAKAFEHRIPIIEAASKEALGKAIGRPERAVVGVCDSGLAKSLSASLREC